MLPLRLDTVPLRLPLTLLLPRRAVPPAPAVEKGSSSPYMYALPVDMLAVDDSDPFFFIGETLESDDERVLERGRRSGIGAPLPPFLSKEPKSWKDMLTFFQFFNARKIDVLGLIEREDEDVQGER